MFYESTENVTFQNQDFFFLLYTNANTSAEVAMATSLCLLTPFSLMNFCVCAKADGAEREHERPITGGDGQ